MIENEKCIACGKESSSELIRIKTYSGEKVCLCFECIKQLYNIILPKYDDETLADEAFMKFDMTPKQIHEYLNEWVIGQDDAKKAIAVAIYNHYKRISSNAMHIKKSNILMAGPTGCGKTENERTIAKMLNVPFAIADATTLTEAGYVGDDVENVLLRLIQAADWDIELAEKGIVYIDEIDKICRKGEATSITRDVSGEGVQQALLKIIEGSEVDVPMAGGRKHPQADRIRIDTSNILFICGGAFESLTMKKEDQKPISFGFVEKRKIPSAKKEESLKLSPQDLIRQGLIPELVGRLPVIVELKKLSEEDLLRILTETKENLIKQYTDLVGLDGVKLKFSRQALEYIAHKAYVKDTGARGLKGIIEDEMMDLMYRLPDEKNVSKVTITFKDDHLIFRKTEQKIAAA